MKKIVLTMAVIFLATTILIGCGATEKSTKKNPDSYTRSDWKTALSWPADCKVEADESLKTRKLADNEYMILLKCFEAAYQSNFRLYHYDHSTSTAKLLKLKGYRKGSGGESEAFTDESFASVESYEGFSKDTSEFFINTYDAGHGGCGTTSGYRWNTTTKEYDLVSVYGNFDCENPIEDSAEWPQIYHE